MKLRVKLTFDQIANELIRDASDADLRDLQAIIAHEQGHRQATKWNVAADLAINSLLVTDGEQVAFKTKEEKLSELAAYFAPPSLKAFIDATRNTKGDK